MKVLRFVIALFFAMVLGLAPGQGEAAPGDISTVAGAEVAGATLNLPYGVAVDGAGNLYIADSGNNRVLKLAAGATTVTTVAGGNVTPAYSGDGGLATQASLSGPEAVAVDGAGNLYIADTDNYRVRKVAAGTGIISTVAGNGTKASAGDGGAATSASLKLPLSLALDASGNLYIADFSGNSIRKVAAATGTISTVTTLTFPTGVAVDGSGNLYIVDSWQHRVWKMAGGTGTKTAVAGNGVAGYNGDNGPATAANLNQPYGLTVDSAGNLFITEMVNRIRKVDASSGIISVVAGTGEGAYSGDGGPAIDAALKGPTGVAVDLNGNIFIADSGNSRIRKVLGNDPPVVNVAPEGGTYSSSLTVQLSVAPERPAIIYYTTDGSVPGFASESFSGSGELGIAATTTLKYFARDLDGNSSSVATQTYSIIPGAPTGVTAVGGSGKATVSFTAPTFTAGGITSYRVTSSPGGFSATGSASPIVVTGLTAGTPYTFTVTASNATGSGPASSSSNSVTPSASYPLTVAFAGTGGGSVNGGVACVSGATCAAAQLELNAVVTLTASADSDSTFGGWSGCGSVSGSICTVTMSGAKTVTSTFVAAPKVKIMGGASYSLLSAAYAAAASNSVIQARSVLFDEGTLTLGRAVAVKMVGGYDTSFGSSPGRSFVKGKIVVRSGRLTVDSVTVR